MILYLLCLCFGLSSSIKQNFPLPVVLVHGIASDINEMNEVEDWLKGNNIQKIYKLEIGNGVQDSVIMPMNKQLDILCKSIYNISELANGFNILGLSQGGLLARGYVEKCNYYPVANLITWGTPHQGVFGFSFLNIAFPDIYSAEYQDSYSFAGYWKEPNKYLQYLESANYLPELNNEYYHNESELYRVNIKSLKNFVMVWSPIDGVIKPLRSCKFEYLTDFLSSDQYLYDLIGLKSLFNSKRLFFYEINCLHMQYKSKCFDKLFNATIPYLL
jgi:palmitoyl-protein thioesterase